LLILFFANILQNLYQLGDEAVRMTSNKDKTTKSSNKISKKKNKQTLIVHSTKKLKKTPKAIESNINKSLLSNINSPILKQISPLTRISQWRENRINNKLQFAFKHLHKEFNQREQKLEQRIQEIQQQHETLLLQKQKKLRWLIPLGLITAFAGGYMLFVLTNMQNSMSQMTGSINGMNGYMSTMSNDINSMNHSMATMNNNVEGMATAIAPMGEAAKETTPFIKTFRSFMPF